ncbi:MerR family DNA-binding transcriptional regulator [Clostridium perfringens]|uniref:MerR family DNA-binding transcriptional regulator n=1 Tax=Clostridium perfringens TaxID=1502 RepID=UPI003CC8ACF6
MSKYYSINEFSKILGVSAQTLRNWDNNGRLHPHHTSSNGYRYYSHEQLNQVMNKDYKKYDDKLDELFINTVIAICNLYDGNLTKKTNNKLTKIKELIEGDDGDKVNKGHVEAKQ